jgi:hypothetical protein
MIRRFLLVVAMLSLAVPSGAHAASTTFLPPYQAGPQGGDTYNYINADTSNGQMVLARYYPTPTTTGLGCDGHAGFANFAVTYDAGATPVSKIAIAYSNALVDPYTFINVTAISGDHFVHLTRGGEGAPLRGPVVGSGTDELTLDPPTAGPLTVWFGLQISAACPNFDAALATFGSVTFS